MHLKLTSVVAVLIAVTLPVGASAQEAAGAGPRFTVEAYGGAGTFGRFLEQRIGGAGERELGASPALAVGGAVGVRPWQSAAVRLGFTWSPTELEFEDDRGLGGDELEGEGLADLNAYILSLDVLSFFFGEDRRLAPYAVAGVAGGWWSLGEGEGFGAGEILAEEETQFRSGTVFGTGLQFRATPRLLLRLEATATQLGNPFDGEDAFRVSSGTTFDEPERVPVSRFTVNLAYAFGGR